MLSYLAPCSHVFSVMFSIVITSLEEERAGLCVSRVFVYLACITFLSFSLPLGVRGHLWIVTLAITGLFI